MKDYIKCPVCKNKIEYIYYTGCYGIEESYISCPYCNYSEDFLYGNVRTLINNKEYIECYNDSQNYKVLVNKKLHKEFFMARRNWKKFRKKVNR